MMKGPNKSPLKLNWSGQHTAQRHSVAGDYGSNSIRGEKIPLLFVSCDLMIAVYLRIISWLCTVMINHVWLSIRLNNLIAGYKTNWAKNRFVKPFGKISEFESGFYNFPLSLSWFIVL